MKNETSKLTGSNVLVTGGCGFIGSHLVRRLIDLNVGNITVIDSLRYGNKANIGKNLNNVKIIKYTIKICFLILNLTLRKYAIFLMRNQK